MLQKIILHQHFKNHSSVKMLDPTMPIIELVRAIFITYNVLEFQVPISVQLLFELSCKKHTCTHNYN